MNIRSYIEKIRAKPVRERERIAVIWTAIGFVVILVIWLVSFREMNRPDETQQIDQTSASLNDLKDNFNNGKDSIQNMMQDLPNAAGSTGADNTNPATSNDNLNTDNNTNNQNDTARQNDQNNTDVPQLP